jgi:hypothetical protein
MLRCSMLWVAILRHRSDFKVDHSVRHNPWLSLATDVTRLCFEAQEVIGLRMFGSALGDAEAGEEAWLMVMEKGQAVWDTQFLITKSLVAGEAHLAPARAVALYRRRVQANHRRLVKRDRLRA